MPRGFSDYVNDSIQAKFCKGTSLPSNFPPTTIYAGISSTRPDAAGNNVTEPSGGGYVRFPLPTTSSYWGKESPGIYGSLVPVTFTAYWTGTPNLSLVYYDAASSGNFLAFDTDIWFPTVQGVQSSSLLFPPGYLKVGWVPWWNRRGGLTQFWADALAAWFCQGASITWPTVYVALCTLTPVPTDTGATITEPLVSAGYVRKATGTAWQQLSPGRYGTSGTIIWPTPKASWGSPPACGIVDNSAVGAGNLCFYGHRNMAWPIPPGPPPPVLFPNQLQIALESISD
jgi:hypothetical protein